MQSPYGFWDDVTGNFRCCASQDACHDVATCGGWLKHPAPGPSCKAVCDCIAPFLTVPPPPDGLAPPEGYRFADNTVIVEGHIAVPDASRFGADVLWKGKHTALRFLRPIDEQQLQGIMHGRRPLPTFYDAAGRLAAAVGDIFVQLDSPNQLAVLKKKAKNAGLAQPTRVPYGRHLYRIQSHDPWQSLRALPSLRGPGVRAELDMLRRYEKNFVPNDPRFADQWHLQNTGQKQSVPGVDGRVTEAWDITTGSSDVIIAINDDGVDINHPDLAADCTAPLNFPSNWEQKLGDPVNGFGNHGTSVAGVAAAIADNEEGGAGVCPGCKIMPHMVGEAVGPSLNMTDQQIADGFKLMVDEGAWVINNSWGAGSGDPNFVTSNFPIPPAPQIVKAAFQYAETEGRDGKGTVVVFAAGNENQPVAAYAIEPTVITVAAVDDQGLKSYYSSHGVQVDIAAPSNGGINGIVTTSVQAGYTDTFGGTSSASPFVSGVVGLILSANPELTAVEVRDIIAKSATKIDPVWAKYDVDGHSRYYGHGLVNAYVALRLAIGDCTDPATCPAPSDDCGTDCDKPACSLCRTTADCADGHVCQALPPLGHSVCIAEDTGSCPTGTTAHDGFCIPSRQTCDLCATEEACNGRDDDCNGEVDDGLSCSGIRVLQCPILGEGCDTGQSCAATVCVTACSEDADCGEGRSCKTVKDRYGASTPGVKGCATDLLSTCKPACEMLVSSLTDADIEAFVTCMKDGAASCMEAYSCAQKLPIKM
jgi:subtilisin family serine protease